MIHTFTDPSTWIVAPRDTVMFRDARPFEAGTSAHTLAAPRPSTIAGFVRSRSGTDPKTGKFELSPAEAREISVRGPWIVELDAQGEVCAHYFPAPADAVFYKEDGETMTRRALSPAEIAAGTFCDMPEGVTQLVGFAETPNKNPGKATRGPAFWSLSTLQSWLSRPEPERKGLRIADLGISEFAREGRVHVGIDPDTLTASEGALFQTEMLRPMKYDRDGKRWRQFGYAVMTQKERLDVKRMGGEPTSFGGERRVVSVKKSKYALPWEKPEIHKGSNMLRVVLLTPGIFSRGYLPSFEGADVVAACVNRYEAVSGWDFDTKATKATRRLAPAGSVYWVRVSGDVGQWIRDHHLSCICDEEQDNRDGFGWIAVGEGGMR